MEYLQKFYNSLDYVSILHTSFNYGAQGNLGPLKIPGLLASARILIRKGSPSHILEETWSFCSPYTKFANSYTDKATELNMAFTS